MPSYDKISSSVPTWTWELISFRECESHQWNRWMNGLRATGYNSRSFSWDCQGQRNWNANFIQPFYQTWENASRCNHWSVEVWIEVSRHRRWKPSCRFKDSSKLQQWCGNSKTMTQQEWLNQTNVLPKYWGTQRRKRISLISNPQFATSNKLNLTYTRNIDQFADMAKKFSQSELDSQATRKTVCPNQRSKITNSSFVQNATAAWLLVFYLEVFVDS